MTDSDLKNFLDTEAARINNPVFIADDPVQFPRRFSDQRDIEIVALISAIIAWGRRTMICRDMERILLLMDNSPYEYMTDEGYLDLDGKMNLHRTFFASHLQWLLKGLRRIYKDYGSLESFSASINSGEKEYPAWHLVENLNKIISVENDGATCCQCLPVNMRTTALKRVNMALRWLVRDDGIVDMGIWKSIPKSKLFIPLDVHVGNTARDLGLLERKANDRRSVELLTASLAEMRPEDPVYYDYALFGIGITGGKLPGNVGANGL